MKRVIFIFFVGLAFTSCKKEYVCQCTTKNSSTEFPVNVLKESDAVQRCARYQDTYNANLDSNYTCSIK